MNLKYFSWLKDITNKESEIINDSKIKDIKSLKKYLCTKYPQLKQYILKEDIIRIAINLEYILSPHHIILPEDEIALFPPVSGG